MVVTIRGDDLPLIGWPPGIDGWPIQNVGDDDDLDGDWPSGIDGDTMPVQNGPVIPPDPVNDTDPCPWFIDGGDGWGITITNGEVPW